MIFCQGLPVHKFFYEISSTLTIKGIPVGLELHFEFFFGHRAGFFLRSVGANRGIIAIISRL